MSRQVIVSFEGEGAGVGELTWGQQELWPAMQRERSSFSLCGTLPLAPGRTVDDVAGDLRYVMSRHASLRTRLRFAADGHPQQVVAGSGTAALEVVDAGDADPAEVAAAVQRRYDEKVFDYAREWPIRWAVIVSRGVATHQVLVICHLAADGMGALAMLDDLAEREQADTEQASRGQGDGEQADGGQAGREQTAGEQADREQAGREQASREQTGREQTGREQTGREQTGREQTGREQTGRERADGERADGERANGRAGRSAGSLQPLDLARMQGEPAARRQSAAALAHWERLLRAMPARRWTDPADEQAPRYWQAFYDSPAAHLAVQAVAARTGAPTATVLLAAHAVALARLTGVNPAVSQVVVNNRFRRGLAEIVSPLCDFSLCVIDVADVSFDEVVSRAWRSAMRAYKYAYCDPVRRDELIARISAERGEELDIRCYVNDRRMRATQEPEGELPGPAQVRAALALSSLSWGYRNELPNERCYLHINNIPDSVNCELRADTRYVSPAAMAGLLRELEAAVVEAAVDPAAVTGVAPC